MSAAALPRARPRRPRRPPNAEERLAIAVLLLDVVTMVTVTVVLARFGLERIVGNPVRLALNAYVLVSAVVLTPRSWRIACAWWRSGE